MEQLAPKLIFPEDDLLRIYDSLGIIEHDLINGLKPMIVNTGNSFLIIPLRNVNVLKDIKADLETITVISKKYGLVGFYPFTLNLESSQPDATARMFAPYFGISEEAATGMAAGPLACYLFKYLAKKEHYTIEQGTLMSVPSPSLLHVELRLNENEIQKLFVGGYEHLDKEAELQFSMT